MMKKLAILAVLMLLAATCMAQFGQPPDYKQRMKAASFLEGDWNGSGWIQIGPGGRSTFAEAEKIYFKLDSAILVIEGRGVGRTLGGDTGTVHQAFAVLSWDDNDSSYHMHAWRSTGDYVDAHAEIPNDTTFIWQFAIPNYGTTRYTIAISGGKDWREIGEISKDGTTWQQFLEMTLERL